MSNPSYDSGRGNRLEEEEIEDKKTKLQRDHFQSNLANTSSALSEQCAPGFSVSINCQRGVIV